MYHQKILGLPNVVTPHWFDDSFKSQRPQPVAHYSWPDPPVFHAGSLVTLSTGLSYEDDLNQRITKAARELSDTPKSAWVDRDREKQASLIWRSVNQDAVADPSSPITDHSTVWSGHTILLSEHLEIEPGTREALEAAVKRGGGTLYNPSTSGDFDILITMYSEGDDYVTVSATPFTQLDRNDRTNIVPLQAREAQKLIGTIAWVYYVSTADRISAPEDHLLHYPTPRTYIDGFADKARLHLASFGLISHLISYFQEFSLSNYSGEARDYLKKVIARMGGTVTPTLSIRTDFCIAAR